MAPRSRQHRFMPARFQTLQQLPRQRSPSPIPRIFNRLTQKLLRRHRAHRRYLNHKCRFHLTLPRQPIKSALCIRTFKTPVVVSHAIDGRADIQHAPQIIQIAASTAAQIAVAAQ